MRNDTRSTVPGALLGRPRVFLLTSLGLLLALPACGSSYRVVNSKPRVAFAQPPGTQLRNQGGRSLRVAFDGNAAKASFLCRSPGAGKKGVRPPVLFKGKLGIRRAVNLVMKSGGARKVTLHTPEGQRLARGVFCIYPTWGNRHVGAPPIALTHYQVRVPTHYLQQVQAGRMVALYEPYDVDGQHDTVAWVLVLMK